MSLTKIIGRFFTPRQRKIEHYAENAEALQQQVMEYLIAEGTHTEYGRNHLLSIQVVMRISQGTFRSTLTKS